MATSRIRDRSEAIRITGLKELAAEFRMAGPEVEKKLKEVNKRFTEEVAEKARNRVYPSVPGHQRRGPQRPSGSGSISRTRASIRSNATSRGASIVGGGAKAPGFFGHEFGGGAKPTTRQFPQHKGREGYFMYPTIRSSLKEDANRWNEILDEVFRAGGKI